MRKHIELKCVNSFLILFLKRTQGTSLTEQSFQIDINEIALLLFQFNSLATLEYDLQYIQYSFPMRKCLNSINVNFFEVYTNNNTSF